MIIGILIASLTTSVTWGLVGWERWRREHKNNKLSLEGYEALQPKSGNLEKLPELKRFSRGVKTYRDAGDEPMRCHRCERPCIYCKRLDKRKKTGR